MELRKWDSLLQFQGVLGIRRHGQSISRGRLRIIVAVRVGLNGDWAANCVARGLPCSGFRAIIRALWLLPPGSLAPDYARRSTSFSKLACKVKADVEDGTNLNCTLLKGEDILRLYTQLVRTEICAGSPIGEG